MNSIYILSVHTERDRNIWGIAPVSRAWGWFLTLKEAVHEITTDRASIAECLYDYAAIEEVKPGVGAMGKAVYWAKWDHKKRGWKRCRRPQWAVGLVNLGIG